MAKRKEQKYKEAVERRINESKGKEEYCKLKKDKLKQKLGIRIDDDNYDPVLAKEFTL